MSEGYYWAFLLVGIVGLVSFRRLEMVRWIAMVVAAWGAFHILFFSEPRFHTPLLPLVALLAALGIGEIQRLARGEAEVTPTRRAKGRRLQVVAGQRGGRRR